MTRTDDSAKPVIVLDLRYGAHTLDTRTALRTAVDDQLRGEDLPDAWNGHYRFLLVDTPSGLTVNLSLYERILGYGTRAQVLGLVVGDLPDAEPEPAWDNDWGPDPGYRPPPEPESGEVRCLRRPAALQAPDAGLLWAGDLRAARTAGAPVTADDPEALGILVDLLKGLFDDTLDVLAALPVPVAVPGVRLLEYDLSDAARKRAWREALGRFAGERAAAGALSAKGGDIPVEIPKPVDELAAGRPTGPVPRYRVPGGAADRALLDCSDALDRAASDRARLSRLSGLLTGVGRHSTALALKDASHGLAAFRTLVLKALQGAGPGAGSAAETTQRLTGLGIHVPPGSGTKEATGDALRRLTERMLDKGLALRSVAERFAALSEQVAPVPGAGQLTEADRRCPPELPRRVSADQRFTVAAAGPGQLAGAFAASALAALWPWPGSLAALSVVLVLAGGSLLARARRPNLGAAPPSAAGALPQVVAATLGIAASTWLGTVWQAPPWACLVGLLCGLGLACALVTARWRRAVGRWWELTGADDARTALNGLDTLLAEAVLRQWWAADERMHCANAARMVAGVLRGAAATADDLDSGRTPGHASGQPVDDGWDDPAGDPVGPETVSEPGAATERPEWMPAPDFPGTAPVYADRPGASGNGMPTGPAATGSRPGSGATADAGTGEGPRWLDREAGEGGPHLVDTLVEDLTDVLVRALDPYWATVERGQSGGAAISRIEDQVRRMLDTTHRHLLHNGVVASPPFARQRGQRGDAEALLGIGHQRVAEATDPDPDSHRVVELTTEGQRRLLDRNPSAVEWIRFAPQAAWDGAGGDGNPDAHPRRDSDTHATERAGVRSRAVRTASGRFAGLLKLVPLRPTAVRPVRQLIQGDDEDSDYPGIRSGHGYELGGEVDR